MKDEGMTIDLAAEISSILTEFQVVTEEALTQAAVETAKEAAEKLKNAALTTDGLHNTGEYAKGFKSKKEGKGAVVYNKDKPMLTHILENGHQIKNAYGTYDRTNGIRHIKPVENWANAEFEKKVREKI